MRKSLSDIFMETAINFANRSTCTRIKVGAVLVKNDRIVSTGYNGVPKGMIHCEDYFKENEYTDEKHREFSIKYELHAEQNLLAEALKNNINPEGGKVYLTLSPCGMCAKLLLATGIKEVYYLEEYDRDVSGIELLNSNNIICKKYKFTR
jgi:dCMP deaminase